MKYSWTLLTLICMTLPACITRKATFSGTPFSTYESAEAANFDPEKLDQVTAFIQENARTTGMVVLYKGKMIYSYGDIQKVSYIASCRKSILSMLYGKYVDNGTIDLTQNIGALGINEKDGLLPIEKEATIDHIITSRSGVFHVAANGGYDKGNFLERGSVEPGSYWVYNNWDFNVAGHIFEQYAGRSIYEEIEEQFAKPLGFEDWNIKNQKKYGKKSKSQYPAYHMYFSTRDMAKLGQLMLNEGEWNGQQLISKEWIEKTTSMVTPFETLVERFGPAHPDAVHMSYGYMWWLVENYRGKEVYKGAYQASGYGGQFITIIPEMEMVVAHKTKLDLLTLTGLSYKETSGDVYWQMIDQIIEAKR